MTWVVFSNREKNYHIYVSIQVGMSLTPREHDARLSFGYMSVLIAFVEDTP